MGVGWKTGFGFHHIVVENPERSELNVGRVIVIRKGKEPVGSKPPEIGKMSLVGGKDLDHAFAPCKRQPAVEKSVIG
jgi:hypothetical protein